MLMLLFLQHMSSFSLLLRAVESANTSQNPGHSSRTLQKEGLCCRSLSFRAMEEVDTASVAFFGGRDPVLKMQPHAGRNLCVKNSGRWGFC